MSSFGFDGCCSSRYTQQWRIESMRQLPGIYHRIIEYAIIVMESKPVQRAPSQYHVVHRTAKYYVGVIHTKPAYRQSIIRTS